MTHDASFDSTVLTIGGDTAYDVESDAWDGSAVKVAPSSGQLAQGTRPGRQMAAQHRNWIDQQVAAILTALIANDDAYEIELASHTTELANHETRITAAEDYEANHSPRILVFPFLASGTFVVPGRCSALLGYGCGGGGAGGAGSVGVNTHDRWIAGAGGGGGAVASLQLIPGSVPGETLNVDVGDGGVIFGAAGATGGDGGDTVVRRGSTPLTKWLGAQGGRGAVGGHMPVDWVHYSEGGCAVRGTGILLIGPAGGGIRMYISAGTAFGVASGGSGGYSLYFPLQPGQGGYGGGGSSQGNPAAAGCYNPVGGFLPGAGGATGTDGDPNAPPGDVTMRGGGGGGGGAAGPFGPGGEGAHGQAGVAQYGVAGTAPANSGAGGGGGGSAGFCDGTNFPGPSYGANGGSGRLYLICVMETT